MKQICYNCCVLSAWMLASCYLKYKKGLFCSDGELCVRIERTNESLVIIADCAVPYLGAIRKTSYKLPGLVQDSCYIPSSDDLKLEQNSINWSTLLANIPSTFDFKYFLASFNFSRSKPLNELPTCGMRNKRRCKISVSFF